jgi:salicylate hydroxylase
VILQSVDEKDRWWVVHRAHLHEGLVQIAEKHGAKLLINSRVNKIEYESSEKVHVTTEAGKQHNFDLLIGSDGVKSVVRKTLFPDVKPTPPTTNCAYRAIVPYEQIIKDPIAKELIKKLTMEVWMSDKSYIISYLQYRLARISTWFSHTTSIAW